LVIELLQVLLRRDSSRVMAASLFCMLEIIIRCFNFADQRSYFRIVLEFLFD